MAAMTFSPKQLQRYLPAANSCRWWVALSGGLDSCVLLHALASLRLPVNLQALYVNHQISPNANAWQQHCADFCAQLHVPFTAVNVSVKNAGRGIEDAAREARYAVFVEHLQQGDCLLTAHHADDQAETLLLRLMRGTGPRGLAVMAQARPLGVGVLHRPLLKFTREQLENYAKAHDLHWVNDESNRNDHYDRNYLRNQVMPLLRERWPHFSAKWQQTAELCAANEALIEELAAQDLLVASLQKEKMGTSLLLSHLEGLSQARRHNLLRYWLRVQGLSTPEQQHLQQIDRQVLAARQDAETQITWGDVSLRVYRQRLYALPLAQLPSAPDMAFSLAIDPLQQPQISLPTGARLTFESQYSAFKTRLRADLPQLNIRFRQGGERCKPAGRARSQTLKHLLQDYGVEPWLRASLPLLYSGDELVAVGDLWVCSGYEADVEGYCLKYDLVFT